MEPPLLPVHTLAACLRRRITEAESNRKFESVLRVPQGKDPALALRTCIRDLFCTCQVNGESKSGTQGKINFHTMTMTAQECNCLGRTPRQTHPMSFRMPLSSPCDLSSALSPVSDTQITYTDVIGCNPSCQGVALLSVATCVSTCCKPDLLICRAPEMAFIMGGGPQTRIQLPAAEQKLRKKKNQRDEHILVEVYCKTADREPRPTREGKGSGAHHPRLGRGALGPTSGPHSLCCQASLWISACPAHSAPAQNGCGSTSDLLRLQSYGIFRQTGQLTADQPWACAMRAFTGPRVVGLRSSRRSTDFSPGSCHAPSPSCPARPSK